MAQDVTFHVGTIKKIGHGEQQDGLGERFFLLRLGALYALLSLLLVVVLDPFWSANWDAQTFLEAARSFWDGGSLFDLYEKSRAFTPWPYAYPPMYAIVLAPFIWVADLATGEPANAWWQLIGMRLPLLVADVGIAFVLHGMLRRATGERWIGRLAAALWLFNPVLFYHTAVQAHLESLWLWPVLAAYAWLQEREELSEEEAQSSAWWAYWWPMLLFVIAMTVKQSALLYTVPFGLWLLWQQRWRDVLLFALLFGVLFGGLSLPFFLYSDDFRYMVIDYVAQMPVQIQSWQVWTLALADYRLEQTRTTFPTVRFALYLTLLLNIVLTLLAFRKQRSWYAIGWLVTLGFLLTAQKAMAYHYPILLPFLLAYGLRLRHFRMVGITFAWTSWVLVSPYFAPWANMAHLPFYAMLGTLNSFFYGFLLWQVLTTEERFTDQNEARTLKQATHLVYIMTLLAYAFVLACLAYPIRLFVLDQLPDANALTLLGAMLALLLGLFVVILITFKPIAAWSRRTLALPMIKWYLIPRPIYITLALVFVPLFFTWFTMNAEITAVIEKGVIEAWSLD